MADARLFPTAQVAGTAPLVPVADLAASLAFYTDVLGFTHEVGTVAHGYALVRRGSIMIALQRTDDPDVLKVTATNISAQIWVADLDVLWSEISPRLTGLPDAPGEHKARVRAPFDQPYGTREFHLKDPDGFLMLFTQMQVAPTGAQADTAPTGARGNTAP